MEKNNIETFQSVKAIVCGGETLYDSQRKFLEEIFQSMISIWSSLPYLFVNTAPNGQSDMEQRTRLHLANHSRYPL